MMRDECLRPLVPNALCETPIVDPKVVTFLSKSALSPREGLKSALKVCQEKLLDVLGPLTKIFELVKAVRLTDQPLDPSEVTGWIQRAICFMEM